MSYSAPEFEKSALISIDVQCDFVDGGSCPIAGTSAAIPQMAVVARAYRAAGLPIVHMVRIYRPDGSNADVCRRAALEGGAQIVLPASAGVELASGLLAEGAPGLDCELLLSGEAQALGPAEWALFKPRWGAFFGAGGFVEAAGRDYARPNCPRTSMYESERDFRMVLAEDAISGLYERRRDELAAIGVVMMRAANFGRRRVSTWREPAQSRLQPRLAAPLLLLLGAGLGGWRDDVFHP